MVSDVPLGAFLSGGVDSSLVVGLMAEAVGQPRQDVLDRLRRAGVRRARACAPRRRAFRHRASRVRRPAGCVGSSTSWSSHFDEPFADSSAIPTWYVSEMARQHVTVVLSGDGGDELFGGYDRYLPHPRVVAFDAPARARCAASRRSRRRGCRTACAARTSCATWPRRRGRYLDAIGSSAPTRGRRCWRRPAGEARRSGPGTPLARHFERFAELPSPRR